MALSQVHRESRDVLMDLIDEPELPARTAMDETKLDDLTSSIRANGVISPIAVVPKGDRYKVIAGHRRTIAGRRAGLVMMPCFVYPDESVDLTVIQAHENSRREDLNPADEAIWFDELLEHKCGGDIDKLCALVGEKLSYVDNRLALFRGDKKVFLALKDGLIKIGVAHALNKLADAPMRNYYLSQAIAHGATVALVDGWVAEWQRTVEGLPPSSPAPAASGPIAQGSTHDPHYCYVCRKSDPRFIPQLIPIHDHCLLAIVEPLLATYRGEV